MKLLHHRAGLVLGLRVLAPGAAAPLPEPLPLDGGPAGVDWWQVAHAPLVRGGRTAPPFTPVSGPGWAAAGRDKAAAGQGGPGMATLTYMIGIGPATALAVFGSRATGDFAPRSDLDLLVVVPDGEDHEYRHGRLSLTIMARPSLVARAQTQEPFVRHLLSRHRRLSDPGGVLAALSASPAGTAIATDPAEAARLLGVARTLARTVTAAPPPGPAGHRAAGRRDGPHLRWLLRTAFLRAGLDPFRRGSPAEHAVANVAAAEAAGDADAAAEAVERAARLLSETPESR